MGDVKEPDESQADPELPKTEAAVSDTPPSDVEAPETPSEEEEERSEEEQEPAVDSSPRVAPAVEPPGDPKKEWPLAIAIMVVLAFIAFAFVSMLRPE